MKRPIILLIKALLEDLGSLCSVTVTKDEVYILRRFEHEGMSFITQTLPLLSDYLENGLEQGQLLIQTTSYRLYKNGRLPVFLRGFFELVFDKDGVLRLDANPDCIYAIRQICRFFKKPKMDCSQSANDLAELRYLSVEEDLRKFDLTKVDSSHLDLLRVISNITWSNIFADVSPEILRGRHGPGSTAERLSLNKRWSIKQWYQRFESSFPMDLHVIPNWGWHDHLSGVKEIAPLDEPPVRVVFVPKTQSTPRVIAIEPSCVMYAQQALMDYTVKRIESFALTRKSIRFTDQSTNQKLAHQSSIDRRYATIDLKDASDRVSNDLVLFIFKNSPLLQYMQDCRSLTAVTPSGIKVFLKKFASQGSAMCFPTEAMVFYTLIQTYMHLVSGKRPSSRSVLSYSKDIAVYGDDLIVPNGLADGIATFLESFGLKVNRAKSFSKSLFRESCGADFYAGISVKPIYLRMLPIEDRDLYDPSLIMSWAKTSDQFYEAGLWKMSQCMRDILCNVVGNVPRVIQPSGGLTFKSFIYNTNCRWSSTLQQFGYRSIAFKAKERSDSIRDDGLASVNKTFSRFGLDADLSPATHFGEIFRQTDYLRSVKRGVFNAKRRWFSFT